MFKIKISHKLTHSFISYTKTNVLNPGLKRLIQCYAPRALLVKIKYSIKLFFEEGFEYP